MRELLLKNFYSILHVLHGKAINNGYHYLANPVPPAFKQSGLYFFFDPNIIRDISINKVVRIGITGNNNNNRLALHQSGSLSVSVFRKHVCSALANSLLPFNALSINSYIHQLQYLFLPINNQVDLKYLEKKTIELVSNRYQPILFDVPPINWLGYNSPSPAIVESHLWNVHHVGNYNHLNEEEYTEALKLLSIYVNVLP